MTGRGRGHWDRKQSRADRRAAQRALILESTVRASAEHGRALTLGDIVLGAKVGRNTFYEHFEDVDAAIRAAAAEGIEATSRALEVAATEARTPIERLRGIARAWVESALEHPGLAAAFRPDAARRPAHAVEKTGLEEALRRALMDAKAAGVIGRGPEAIRLICLLGAFEATARLVAEAESPLDSEEVVEVLVDLALRAFR